MYFTCLSSINSSAKIYSCCAGRDHHGDGQPQANRNILGVLILCVFSWKPNIFGDQVPVSKS